MPRTLNVQTYQGANLKIQAFLLEQNNSPVDLSNTTIQGTIKHSGWSSNAIASLICTVGDTSNGEFFIELYPENTINISADRYVYTIMKETSNVKTVVLVGNIDIKPGLGT